MHLGKRRRKRGHRILVLAVDRIPKLDQRAGDAGPFVAASPRTSPIRILEEVGEILQARLENLPEHLFDPSCRSGVSGRKSVFLEFPPRFVTVSWQVDQPIVSPRLHMPGLSEMANIACLVIREGHIVTEGAKRLVYRAHDADRLAPTLRAGARSSPGGRRLGERTIGWWQVDRFGSASVAQRHVCPLPRRTAACPEKDSVELILDQAHSLRQGSLLAFDW
jgi:hypothetical protein